jgi:hypothetical protein
MIGDNLKSLANSAIGFRFLAASFTARSTSAVTFTRVPSLRPLSAASPQASPTVRLTNRLNACDLAFRTHLGLSINRCNIEALLRHHQTLSYYY